MASNQQQIKVSLQYNPLSPPAVSLYCLSLPREKKIANVEISTDHIETIPRVEFVLGNNHHTVEGDDLTLSRAICCSLPNCRVLIDSVPENFPLNANVFESEVLHWINFARRFKGLSLEMNKAQTSVVAKVLTDVDSYLKLRTYLVGHHLSLGDISLYSAVGKLFGFNNLTNSNFGCKPKDLRKCVTTLTNMKRWIRLIHSTNATPTKTFKAVLNAYQGCPTKFAQSAEVSNEKRKENELHDKNSKKHLFEGKLPGAEKGKVVTRFSPEPSGYLHIGHAKAALLSSHYAKLYEGKFLLRFDDTNPVKEKMEFEQTIMEDLKLLNINTDRVSHTSDYFDKIEEYCEQLLSKGIFYCDDTPLEQMRFERGEGILSQCRNNSIEENLARWKEMKKGSEIGLKNCVRAKIYMLSKNKCMRDPVMYRCVSDALHHIHGDKYKVYPMYDFACPIVDHLEGITHAMRANEYADRIPQYQWVLNTCGFPPIIIYEFSRLNLVNTVLSKRKLQWLVENGVVESWEDPRFPTVRGIRRHGMTPEALTEFIMEQGASKNVNLMEWDKLWAKNKQIIDPIVPRYMSVDAHAVPVTLSNGPITPETKERNLHPKNAELGQGIQIYGKDILIEREDAEILQDGEEVTLMKWSNVFVEKINRNSDGSVQSIIMKLNPDGDFKKTKKKIHWVSTSEPLIPARVTLREFDHIISKKKPEDDDKIEEICNRDSIQDTEALADPGIIKLSKGAMLQFERRGYFILDQIATEGCPSVFIKIPDGKSKSMSVVQSKIAAEKLAKGH